MDQNLSIQPGNIIQDLNSKIKYRVIHMRHNSIFLCEMGINRLNIFIYNTEKLMMALSLGEIELAEDNQDVYDISSFSDSEIKNLEIKKQIISEIEKEYGPTFLNLQGKASKPFLKTLAEKYSVTTKTLSKYIRIYLQNGFNIYSLLDSRKHKKSSSNYCECFSTQKRGRKGKYMAAQGIALSQDTILHFNDGLDFYKSLRTNSIQKAYDYIIGKYYSETTYDSHTGGLSRTVRPVDERPTYNQFYYYIQKHLSSEEMDIIKTSKKEQRNEKRLLLSDSMYSVSGPGDRVQMDECELDLSIRSCIDPNLSVGRVILYVMMDVYSHLVLAIGLSFDNNSVRGLTNCLINLGENKTEYCKKYGVIIDDSLWPNGCIPNRILSDRGSEYLSNEGERIFRELGTTMELVPAATGSLKGIVEQFFHQLQSHLASHTEGYGLITTRHDSKHHEEAVLTIDIVRKLIINYVIWYNNNYYMEQYQCTKDMKKKQIRPIPIELWNYGCKTNGAPRPIPHWGQYSYTLMLPYKAILSRKGIRANGLFYINHDDHELLNEMYRAQNKHVPFTCRIDPRDIGSVYYLRDNQLMRASLNSQKFGHTDWIGLTLNEWNQIREITRAQRAKHAVTSQESRIYMESIADMLVLEAASNYNTPANTKDIRKNRKIEKESIANSLNMYEKLKDFVSNPASPMQSFNPIPNRYDDMPLESYDGDDNSFVNNSDNDDDLLINVIL